MWASTECFWLMTDIPGVCNARYTDQAFDSGTI